MKLIRGGIVSSGPGIGQPRDDGGHRVDPRDPPLAHQIPEVGAMEPVIEHERRTGDERGEKTDDFGIDVEERQRVESPVIRREAMMRRQRCGPSAGVAPGAGGSPWVHRSCPTTPEPLRPERPCALPPAARGRRACRRGGSADIDPADVDAVGGAHGQRRRRPHRPAQGLAGAHPARPPVCRDRAAPPSVRPPSFPGRPPRNRSDRR